MVPKGLGLWENAVSELRGFMISQGEVSQGLNLEGLLWSILHVHLSLRQREMAEVEEKTGPGLTCFSINPGSVPQWHGG